MSAGGGHQIRGIEQHGEGMRSAESDLHRD